MRMFRIRGKVKNFNCKKGYGFIIPDDFFIRDGKEVFVHYTAIINDGGFRSLAKGEYVEFDLLFGSKGFYAANVSGPNRTLVKGTSTSYYRNNYFDTYNTNQATYNYVLRGTQMIMNYVDGNQNIYQFPPSFARQNYK